MVDGGKCRGADQVVDRGDESLRHPGPLPGLREERQHDRARRGVDEQVVAGSQVAAGHAEAQGGRGGVLLDRHLDAAAVAEVQPEPVLPRPPGWLRRRGPIEPAHDLRQLPGLAVDEEARGRGKGRPAHVAPLEGDAHHLRQQPPQAGHIRHRHDFAVRRVLVRGGLVRGPLREGDADDDGESDEQQGRQQPRVDPRPSLRDGDPPHGTSTVTRAEPRQDARALVGGAEGAVQFVEQHVDHGQASHFTFVVRIHFPSSIASLPSMQERSRERMRHSAFLMPPSSTPLCAAICARDNPCS